MNLPASLLFLLTILPSKPELDVAAASAWVFIFVVVSVHTYAMGCALTPSPDVPEFRTWYAWSYVWYGRVRRYIEFSGVLPAEDSWHSIACGIVLIGEQNGNTVVDLLLER